MRRRNYFIYMAAVVCLAAPAAPAQLAPTKASGPDSGRFGDPTGIAANLQNDLYGVVKKIDAREIVLEKTKFGEDQTIVLERKTKFVRDRKASTLAKLQVGDPVYVDFKTDKKTGVMTAKKIISGVTATP